MQTILSPAHPDAGKLDFHELEDRIRDRAYFIYEEKRFEKDHALDHWLQAKAQVLVIANSPMLKKQEPLSSKTQNE